MFCFNDFVFSVLQVQIVNKFFDSSLHRPPLGLQLHRDTYYFQVFRNYRPYGHFVILNTHIVNTHCTSSNNRKITDRKRNTKNTSNLIYDYTTERCCERNKVHASCAYTYIDLSISSQPSKQHRRVRVKHL